MDQDTAPHTVVVEEEEEERRRRRITPTASNGHHSLALFGIKCPKEEIVFLCQIVILYTVIVISIYT